MTLLTSLLIVGYIRCRRYLVTSRAQFCLKNV